MHSFSVAFLSSIARLAPWGLRRMQNGNTHLLRANSDASLKNFRHDALQSVDQMLGYVGHFYCIRHEHLTQIARSDIVRESFWRIKRFWRMAFLKRLQCGYSARCQYPQKSTLGRAFNASPTTARV